MTTGGNDVLDVKSVFPVKLLEDVQTTPHDDVPAGIGVDPAVMQVVKVFPCERNPLWCIGLGYLFKILFLCSRINVVLCRTELSLRGSGKLRILALHGQTKKDRTAITVGIFL